MNLILIFLVNKKLIIKLQKPMKAKLKVCWQMHCQEIKNFIVTLEALLQGQQLIFLTITQQQQQPLSPDILPVTERGTCMFLNCPYELTKLTCAKINYEILAFLTRWNQTF